MPLKQPTYDSTLARQPIEAHNAPTWDKPSSAEAARPLQMRFPSLDPEARDAPTWDKPSSTKVARLLQMKCPSCFGE